ncbi:MAG TPA: VWA domain-containing protein [Candidatus Baltobacteraceae bacterium]|nr:VWA domain-containing protein [Candidatus Baltobacteraceae bacterium]
MTSRTASRIAFRPFVLLALAAFLSGGIVQGQQAPTTAAPPQPAAGTSPPETQVPLPPGAPEPPIKVTTGLVHLVVTVTDRHHNFITDLDRSDFKILENGLPQQIRFFGSETDLPLRIGLLLDTSNSIRPRLQFEKDAAIDFLTKVIRREKDDAFLMTFDNEPQVIQDYTDDFSLLQSAIEEQRAGGGTALNDAIVMASQKLAHAPIPKTGEAEVRRVIVIISDGNDNLSDHTLSDAIDAAIRSEAAIFTVSTNTDWLAVDDESRPSKYSLDPGDKILQNFADQTGGHAFFPYRVDDLAQSFLDIGTELRSQYFIAYSPVGPPPRGEYRKIEVDTDRKGLVVRTRKGYYAVASSAEGPSAQ